MSYDLQLATVRKPSFQQARAWAWERGGTRVEGDLDGSAGGMIVRRRTLLRWKDAVLADGPIHAESGDLADALLSGVRGPRWLVEFHIGWPRVGVDAPLAESLAIHLAKENDGAVYDPQEDRLVWPAEAVRKVVRRPEQRIRLLNLDWYPPVGELTDQLPLKLLSALRDLCPEALPRRYGVFEPPQGRFEGDDPDGQFADFWRTEAETDYGSHLLWTTTRPVLGGSATLPDRRETHKPSGVARAIRISLNLNGTTLDDDDRWLAKSVSLFEGLARRLGAFYACGYVERNVVLKRQVWYAGDTERYPQAGGPWFIGLPTEPTWLAWFGAQYRDLVAGSLLGQDARRVGDGLLVRYGEKPMDRDQLSNAPRLPDDVVWRRVGIDQQQARLIPDLS